jgi:hypothetical protein
MLPLGFKDYPYLSRFVEENEIFSIDESEQFEWFVNYCQIYKFYPGAFDLQDVSTSKNDNSIDGAAILVADELILTSDEAESHFTQIRPRQTVNVRYIFIQSKRSEGFDAGDILKFGQGVDSLLADDAPRPPDPVLAEISAIHRVVVENLNKVENGRPECLLFYATTGTWNENSGLDSQTRYIEQKLRDTALFNTVTFKPLDRENLIDLWNQTRTPVAATFAANHILPLPVIENVAEAYLAIVSADSFVESVLTDSDGRIRSSVFDHNVRAFLGDENPVNSKIKAVLETKTQHDRFAILNNGLTIVAPDVKVQGTKVSVADFQIVNGCQTSHVLFRNKSLLSKEVQIVIRIIEAEESDILAQVVEATNSQSNVTQSQFLSITPFVRGLERFFAAFEGEDEADRKLYFERRTRQFSGQSFIPCHPIHTDWNIPKRR